MFNKIPLQTPCASRRDHSRSARRLSEQVHKCRNNTGGRGSNSREQQPRKTQPSSSPGCQRFLRTELYPATGLREGPQPPLPASNLPASKERCLTYNQPSSKALASSLELRGPQSLSQIPPFPMALDLFLGCSSLPKTPSPRPGPLPRSEIASPGPRTTSNPHPFTRLHFSLMLHSSPLVHPFSRPHPTPAQGVEEVAVHFLLRCSSLPLPAWGL